jgi:hypothetical protein
VCYKSAVDALLISILANVVLGLVLFGVLLRRRVKDSDRLTEPEQALALYRIRFPTARGRVTLATDGRAALLELNDGSVGLIERCGRRWNARTLEPREIAGVDRARDGALTVCFADFGWPRARVQLSDPGICRGWMERLDALRDAASPGRERTAHRA